MKAATKENVETIVKREIEKNKAALAAVWGDAMATAAVDYAADLVKPNPPQTDLIMACGVGLLGKYIEGLEKQIADLRAEVDALKDSR